jgi:hypothetical protein
MRADATQTVLAQQRALDAAVLAAGLVEGSPQRCRPLRRAATLGIKLKLTVAGRPPTDPEQHFRRRHFRIR